MKKFLYLLLAIPVFVACSDDDKGGSTPETQDYVLLSEMRVFTGPTFSNETSTFFLYNGRKLISTSDSNGNSKEYSYDGNNRISKIESFLANGALNATETFLYDSQGRIIQNKIIAGVTGERHVFTYNAGNTVEVRSYTGSDQVQNNDEVIRILTLTDGEMTEMDYTNIDFPNVVYTYDDKFKATRNILGMDKIAISISNARDRKGSMRNVTSESDGVSTTTKTYTYDAAGYPLTQLSESPVSLNHYRVEYEYITVNL